MTARAPLMQMNGHWLVPRLPIGLWLSAAIVLGWVLIALIVPLTALSPNAIDMAHLLQAPSLAHPFGTDQLGRDVLARVLYGSRIDILMALVGVIAPGTIGVIIGLFSGYFSGLADTVLMRLFDIAMAFPFFILVLVVVGILGPGLGSFLIALAIVGWVAYARLVRAEALVIKHAEYILAAKTLGYGDLYIIFRHLLPNAISPVAVYAMTDAVLVMLAGATLGFLGLGAQPPTSEWGVMIASGQEYLVDGWWISFFPGLAAITFGIGLVGISDGLARLLGEHAQ